MASGGSTRRAHQPRKIRIQDPWSNLTIRQATRIQADLRHRGSIPDCCNKQAWH